MATLFIDDEAVRQVNDGTLTYFFAPATNQASADALIGKVWPWPRFIHGQIVRELAAEGAKAIGFDIMFSELKQVLPGESITLTNGEVVSSDEFFARKCELPEMCSSRSKTSKQCPQSFSKRTLLDWLVLTRIPIFRCFAVLNRSNMFESGIRYCVRR
jgi:hypothetical protein